MCEGFQTSSGESVDPLAVRSQLASLLASDLFAGSPRMGRFLRFTVEETLAGNAAQLKEIVIGAKVFDRDGSYDPRLDPIVRVEARRLRLKLRAYYEGPGKRDQLILEFPKGRYSPVFTLRTDSPSAADTPAAAPSEITVAVLPFANLDPGRGSDYFSDGLSEELIHALTLIRGLRVVAWESAAQLRSQQHDIGAVRQRLGALYALRGSIRRTGSRLRITAHLVQTADNHYVWSETFDRQVQDIFAIQEEIATSIAAALNLRFRDEIELAPVPGAARNLEAYNLCLQGRFHARERTLEGLKRSLVLFSEAAAMDNTSVLAYSGLADTNALIAEYGFADGCDNLLKGKAAAERALELDPLSAEAHASLGLILVLYDWDWRRAEAEFARSFELNPSYAPGHFWFASDFLAMQGRLAEAHAEIEIALKSDPLSSVILLGRALFYTFARDYGRSIYESERVLERDPSFYRAYTSIGRTHILSGNYGAAIEMLGKGLSLAGAVPNILGALGQAHALAGNPEEAGRFYSQLQTMAEYRSIPGTCFAFIHLGMGQKEMALTWLERAVARHQPSMVALKMHPVYDGLRAEPRFQALLRTVGFH
ncbi:MAG: hypothetical protein M3Z09_05750 [Acidobacteriota bacterium]|nr:hypothetical protein [Acidobacteriota bacterium]